MNPVIIKAYKAQPVFRTVTAFKPDPIGREDFELPGLRILFDEEVPAFENLDNSRLAYQRQASEIVDAMGQNIPGGLFDAIMVEMMMRKVSLFRVPHFEKGG